MKPEFDDIQNLELEKLNYPNLFMSRRKVTYKQQELAIELLHSVQPDNPCFLSFLQPGSVSKGYHMVSSADAFFSRKRIVLWMLHLPN